MKSIRRILSRQNHVLDSEFELVNIIPLKKSSSATRYFGSIIALFGSLRRLPISSTLAVFGRHFYLNSKGQRNLN